MSKKTELIHMLRRIPKQELEIRKGTTDTTMLLTAAELADRLSEGDLSEQAYAEILHAIKKSVDESIRRKESTIKWYEKSTELLQTSWKARKEVGRERHKDLATYLMRSAAIKPNASLEEADKLLRPFIAQMTMADITQVSLNLYKNQEEAQEKAERLRSKLFPFCVGTVSWGLTGYPEFSLTDDFFHAIAATDFGDAEEEKTNLPYPSFLIRLPPNEIMFGCRSIFMTSFRMEPGDVVPEISMSEGTAALMLFELPNVPISGTEDTQTVETVWKVNDLLKDLKSTNLNLGERVKQDAHVDEIVEATAIARKVVLNTLLYINANGGMPERGQKKVGPDVPVERDHKELPRFRVGRPIKLGPTTRKMLYGRSTTASQRELMSRFMVRGHWRNQVHGPGRSLRKRMWIEPYWKGPENVTEALLRAYEVE